MSTRRGRDGAPATLSFVIPFWNEEAGADRCVTEVREAASALESSDAIAAVELVLVDDGSTDGTAALLARHAAESARVRVLTHESNQGLGAALRTGLSAVTTDWAFYTDADLPVRPEVAADALRYAIDLDIDVVSCERLTRRDGLRRWTMSSGFNLAVRLVVNLPLRDVNAPAKLIWQPVIESSLPQCASAFCDVELLARAIRNGATVGQIGVTAYPRLSGKSSLSSPRTVAATFADLARYGPGLRVRKGTGS